jgi:hypothetical protein
MFGGMTEPPVILGRQCEWRECGSDASWFLSLCGLTVKIYPPTDGLWGRRVWQWRVGDGAGGCDVEKSWAISGIEKRLLEIKAAIPEDPAVEAKRAEGARKCLDQVRESMRIMATNGVSACVFGCKRAVREGVRYYSETIPEVDGKCPKCGLPRWHKDPE